MILSGSRLPKVRELSLRDKKVTKHGVGPQCELLGDFRACGPSARHCGALLRSDWLKRMAWKSSEV